MILKDRFFLPIVQSIRAAVVSLLIAGCVSNNVFDDGRDDVANYESLELSAALPPPRDISLKGDGLRCVELRWTAPEVKVFRYRIERSQKSDGDFDFVANVDPGLGGYVDGAHPDHRLQDSTTYYYRLVSVETAEGPRSQPCEVLSTTTAPPPGAVRNLRVHAAGSRENKLSWESASGAGSLTYRIERSAAETPDKFERVGTTHAMTYVDGGTPSATLKDSSEYLYRVITLNEVGAESEASESVDVVTFPPPTVVQGFEALSGEVRCVPLKWRAAPEDDVVEYHIFSARALDEEFEKIAVIKGRSVTEFLHGNSNPGELEDEATYYYRICAVNDVGSSSELTEPVKVATRHIPPVVSGVTVESGCPREVPVAWDASADTAVCGYEVWRSLEGDDEWQQIRVLNDPKVVKYLDRGGVSENDKLGGLLDGTNYAYRIIAFNAGGVRSSASEPVTATTKFLPATPQSLQATGGLAGVIKLQWAANPESDIKGYAVEVSSREERGFKELCYVRAAAAGEKLTTHETDLEVETTRYYRIKALDIEGLESRWSAVVGATTKALPQTPASLQLTDAADALVLRWEKPPQNDIVKYNVWSRQLLGWKQIGESDRCEFTLDKKSLQEIVSLAVSAVDQDGLESAKSEPIKQSISVE